MVKKCIGRKRSKEFGYVLQIKKLMILLFGIGLMLLVSAPLQMVTAEENFPRIEDMCYSSDRNALHSFAVSYDYVVETFGSHSEEGWVYDQYDIRIKGLHEEEFKLVETVDTTLMYVYSDGKLFYILESDYLSDEKYDESCLDLGIGVLNPEIMEIEWHEKLHFNVEKYSTLGMNDALLAGEKLCLIFEDKIMVYDTKERTCKTIYRTDVLLVNDVWNNHVAFYSNKIYVLNENRDLIAVDIETGESTILAQKVRYTEAQYADYRQQYYVYGNELWRNASVGTKVILGSSEPPVEDTMKYSYIIYKNESEVYLNLNGIYFRYVPDTEAYYLIDPDIDLMNLMINDVIKRQK